MAITFSRPDPSSPAAVGAAQFTVGRRGYEQEEVRDFLRMVSAELARLQERERFLDSELRALQTRGMSAPGVLDEETVTTLLGAETARVLTVAREAAQQMRARAAESAERLVRDASSDAARVREEAEIEASRRRSEVAVDVEAEVELAKQQGREMVNEAREYREKVLTEMARRRESAREQIEQIIHGRDHLLSVFERASSVAHGVVEELKEFDEISDEIAKVSSTANSASAPFDYEKDPEALPNAAESAAAIIETGADSETITEVLENVPVVDAVDPDASEPVTPKSEITQHDSSSMAEHPSSESADTGRIAQVVQLFGKSKKNKSPEPEPTAVVVPENDSPKSPVTPASKKSVDDLFAKLRATSTSAVADETRESTRSTPPKRLEVVKSQPADKTSTKSKSAKVDKSSGKRPRPKAVVPKVDESLFVRRTEALDPLIITMTRKAKRVLADEENSILTYLEGKKAVVALERVLPESSIQTQQYVEALTEDILSAAMSGAKSLSSSMKADLRKKISNASVMQVLAKSIDDNIVRPLRDRIQRCVVQSDGNRDEMSSLVRSAYREWKIQRIDTQIPDLACLAYSRGAYLVLDSGTPVCWMVDPNGPACADAEDNALAGATPLGTEFPTGNLHPTAHAGCRCLVTPSLG
ncbi:MAG: DivIVA domain-containing protein [Actinomycetota bacterium]